MPTNSTCKGNIEQENPPASPQEAYRPRHSLFGVGGYPCPVWGGGRPPVLARGTPWIQEDGIQGTPREQTEKLKTLPSRPVRGWLLLLLHRVL